MESRSQNLPYKAHDVFASGDNVIYFLVSELESSAVMAIAVAFMNEIDINYGYLSLFFLSVDIQNK